MLLLNYVNLLIANVIALAPIIWQSTRALEKFPAKAAVKFITGA